MKRFLSILICIALLSGLCLPVLGASESGQCRAVYVRTYRNWENAYLWTEHENGEIFGPMPGTKMFREGAIYQLCIPDDLTTFTLNGNETDIIGPITAEPGQNLYVTVDAQGVATVEYEGFAEIESTTEPDPTKPAPTKPAPTEPAPTEPEPTESEETDNSHSENSSKMRDLTIKVPADWTSVSVYTWEPADFGDFPGTMVQKSGDVYKVSVKKTMVNLVISGIKGDGTRAQTSDLKLETNGKDVTFEIAEDGICKLSYAGINNSTGGNRKPAAADPIGILSNFRVVGNADWMGNWQADNDQGIMIEIQDGVYRKYFSDVEPGNYALKITKDGKWDNAYGYNGDNFHFTLEEKSTITVEFIIKNGIGVISVYGTGVPCTGDPDDESPDDPLPTDPGTEDPPVTGPSEWTPSMGGSSDDPTDPSATDPTQPSGEETEPSESIAATEPSGTEPSGTEPTEPAETTTVDNHVSDPSPLVNQPVTNMPLFLFGIVAVFAYLLFLLVRRNRRSGEVTPDGRVRQRVFFSRKAVVQAVKDSKPAPPSELDQAVLEAIKNSKQPPNKA